MLVQQLTTWLETHLTLWVLIGLFGQGLFMMRFVYQWIASERAKQSVIPEAFWYFSLGGSLIVLAYGIHQQDLVIIMGQAPGAFIYLRNLYFIRQNKNTNNDA